MKISFIGAPEYMDRNVGYGEASYHIFNQFEKNGIECLIGSPKTKIMIAFIQPDKYLFNNKKQYKIGYTPWESDGIFENWKEPLKNSIDELWTTSMWCANMFKEYTDKPIFVYKHGVQEHWIPQKRSINNYRPFRFLHVGEPAYRKDAQMVVDAFIALYGNNPKFELILKCSGMNTTRIYDKNNGEIKGSPEAYYSNVKVIEGMLSNEQMDGLYNLCDVFVYPSWGEGFGFNPLQAMAQGIPTICTEAWADYGKYITMPIDSKLTDSPWPKIHPGKMFKPNYAELKFYMEDVYEHYEEYSKIAYQNAFYVHKDYNWIKVSKPAIERLKEIEKFKI
jgi:glycosyltransferase involved in cell wall biosynthesis